MASEVGCSALLDVLLFHVRNPSSILLQSKRPETKNLQIWLICEAAV
jgi:hypothetical protein